MRRFFTALPALRTTVTGRRPVAFKSFQLHTFISQYFLGRIDKSPEYYRLVQPTTRSRFEPRTTLRIQKGVLNTVARRTVLWHTSIWRVSKAQCYFIEHAVVWLLIEQQGGWNVLTLGQNPAGVNVIIKVVKHSVWIHCTCNGSQEWSEFMMMPSEWLSAVATENLAYSWIIQTVMEAIIPVEKRVGVGWGE